MKREEVLYVKVDSRNRITLPKKISKELFGLYRVYLKNGQIILEPIKEIPEREKWLFDPKNKAIVDELKKALKQKADRTIDLDALLKE